MCSTAHKYDSQCFTVFSLKTMNGKLQVNVQFQALTLHTFAKIHYLQKTQAKVIAKIERKLKKKIEKKSFLNFLLKNLAKNINFKAQVGLESYQPWVFWVYNPEKT